MYHRHLSMSMHVCNMPQTYVHVNSTYTFVQVYPFKYRFLYFLKKFCQSKKPENFPSFENSYKNKNTSKNNL